MLTGNKRENMLHFIGGQQNALAFTDKKDNIATGQFLCRALNAPNHITCKNFLGFYRDAIPGGFCLYESLKIFRLLNGFEPHPPVVVDM